MLTGLMVVAVVAALLAFVISKSAIALVGIGIVAAILARMAQAQAYQKEHMDTLRIQADALQKLLSKSEDTRGQWAKD
jgi:hypothetical protein